MHIKKVVAATAAAAALVFATATLATSASTTQTVAPGDTITLTCSTKWNSVTVQHATNPASIVAACATVPTTTTIPPTTTTTIPPTTTTTTPVPATFKVSAASGPTGGGTAGSTVRLTATLKNDTAAAINNPGVGFYDSSGVVVGWAAAGAAPLAPGASVTLNTDTAALHSSWTPTAAGTYALTAKPGDNGTDSDIGSKAFSVTVAAAPPTTTTTQPPGSATRFYSASSSWNTKIPTNATYTSVPGLNTGGGWANFDQYSSPIVIAKASDPVVTINAPASWGWPAQTLSLHIPAGQTSSAGTDGNIVVVDGNTAYDFWQFDRPTTNSATVSAWAKSDIVNGSGWGNKNTGQAAGIHATGSALLAGIIYGNELKTGINHALGLAVGKALPGSPPVGEAINSDGCNPPNGENCTVPEGARLAIPRSVPMPAGLSPQGKILWTAMQEYGGFNVDAAWGDPHAVFWSADPLTVDDNDVIALLNPSWTAADLQAIVSNLKRVS